MTEQTSSGPWYRQPWLLFLLIFPGASIIWCTIAITVALNTDNSMVTDDYSKEGRGINMAIARDVQAADMGLIAQLDFSSERLSLTLDTDPGQGDFPYLVLKLFHPTLGDRDRTIQLQRAGGGQYTASVPPNIDGRWYLDLQGPSNDWRLKGEISLPSTSALTLEPAAGRG
ncbi:MAG: FixH family protein [Oleiphilaceae bacterium]|nr:FixH family protein [Oleiphilaceae bacterium]